MSRPAQILVATQTDGADHESQKDVDANGTGILAAGNLAALQAFAEALPGSEPLPGLFIGHGSPMNAIEESHFVRGFRDIANLIPGNEAQQFVISESCKRGWRFYARSSFLRCIRL